MNKLKTMLCAVFTLTLVNASTTAQADSSNFAGPYVGISASGYGMQLAGEARTSPTGGTFETTDLSIGKVAPVTGIELGYAVPLGSGFLIDIGGSYFTGEAKLEFHADEMNNQVKQKDISFKIDDLVNAYIAPTVVLSDTSSLYIKVGLTEADVTVSGDITSPANLSGTTWAVGTRTVLESGIFIKTEAGYTDYNGISAHGKGDSVNTSNSYSAEPTIAFGTVSLGFRF